MSGRYLLTLKDHHHKGVNINLFRHLLPVRDLKNINKNQFQTVDARSRERFEGKVDEPRSGLRRGCIIGSKNLPFKDCINSETNTFKSKDELSKLFIKNNIDITKPIVFTCGTGMTACVLGMAYSIISGKSAVVYDGSWSEYGKI